MAGDVRLVVLSADASPDTGDSPHALVAAQLVQAGVPGVVVLPHPLEPGAAERFFTPLYTSLLEGAGLAEAVGEGRGGRAEQHFVGVPVPQHRGALPPPEPAVLGLVLQPLAGTLLRLLLLLGRGEPARVLACQGGQVSLVVRLEQVAGELLRVDPQVERQAVADDVLFEVEGDVEDRLAGRPPGLHPVGRGHGLHWPDVDEDISVRALMGRPT